MPAVLLYSLQLTETMEKTKAKLPELDKRLTKEVQECKEQIVYYRQEVKTQGQQHDSDFKKVFIFYFFFVLLLFYYLHKSFLIIACISLYEPTGT